MSTHERTITQGENLPISNKLCDILQAPEFLIRIFHTRQNCNKYHPVQTSNFCTSRPDVCQCLVVQTTRITCQKNKPSTQITYVACESKLRSVVRSGTLDRIHAQDTGWQSGVRSCIMSRLPRHLVQKLNAGTVCTKIHKDAS